MTEALRVLFSLIVMTSLLFAQDEEKMIVETENRLSQNIVMLLDISSSMKTNDNFKACYDKMIQVIDSGTDELNIQIVLFDIDFQIVEIDGKTWFELPDAELKDKICGFLTTLGSSNLGTDPTSAFEYISTIYRLGLSVIIVSDGKFYNMSRNIGDCQSTIRRLLAKRTREGKEQVKIFCYGVGPVSTLLKHLAKTYGGWYIHNMSTVPQKPDYDLDIPYPPIPKWWSRVLKRWR